MFVRPTCDLCDVTVDGILPRAEVPRDLDIYICYVITARSLRRWAEHRAKHDNVYLLSAVPLTNSAPNFSHFGDTVPRGVTAAIGIAFC